MTIYMTITDGIPVYLHGHIRAGARVPGYDDSGEYVGEFQVCHAAVAWGPHDPQCCECGGLVITPVRRDDQDDQ